jgi:subtilase family serine protease
VRTAACCGWLIGAVRAVRTRESRRARLLTGVLLLSVVLAGGTGSPGSRASTTAHGAAGPAGGAGAAGSATSVDVVASCLPSSCYAPRLFLTAYGIQPLLAKGIDGRGETVTVLAPFPPPSVAPPAGSPAHNGGGSPLSTGTDIRQDLAAFDSEFGLPAARIQVVTSLAGAASPWRASSEEVQDFEIVHAVAPAATLRVVLLPTNVLASAAKATADMIAGLRLAVSGTDVASISFSLGEHYFTRAQVAQMHSILLGAEARHITVIGSSGDSGGFSDDRFGGTAVKEVSLPASDPLVLAVGGTSLTADPSTGAYRSETVWNGQLGSVSESEGASGGGFSHLYARPAYQDGVPGIGATRGVPDVAGDADPGTGLSVAVTADGKTQIVSASGTSASAPLWGGIMALADQDAHHDLGFVNPAIYRIARGSSYREAFHDITSGSNIQTMPYPGGTAGYEAGPGWDPATGWGSPNAQVLVPLLAS